MIEVDLSHREMATGLIPALVDLETAYLAADRAADRVEFLSRSAMRAAIAESSRKISSRLLRMHGVDHPHVQRLQSISFGVAETNWLSRLGGVAPMLFKVLIGSGVVASLGTSASLFLTLILNVTASFGDIVLTTILIGSQVLLLPVLWWKLGPRIGGAYVGLRLYNTHAANAERRVMEMLGMGTGQLSIRMDLQLAGTLRASILILIGVVASLATVLLAALVLHWWRQ